MKKTLLLATLCAQVLCSTPQSQEPIFSHSIFLFETRNMINLLGLAAKLEQAFPESTPEFREKLLAVLANTINTTELSKAVGRALPEIGHDRQRIQMGIGNVVIPMVMTLTFSGEESLEETVAALKKNGLAHNFIINTNGDIHPVTKENESLEEALKHRPFAVGISGFVEKGFELRDMNAHSISISIVGKDHQPTTPKATQALINLVASLSNRFSIKPTHVLDYGCVALHATPQAETTPNAHQLATLYGRRKVQANLPWQELASHNLALWPRQKDDNIDLSEIDQESLSAWTSLALRKIGYLCTPTQNPNNPHLKGALRAFQQHYRCDDQSGSITENTIRNLNSILVQFEELDPRLKDILPPALPHQKVSPEGREVSENFVR